MFNSYVKLPEGTINSPVLAIPKPQGPVLEPDVKRAVVGNTLILQFQNHVLSADGSKISDD